MPRPPRADEAGGLYHALNRGNLRATIFHKDADFEAFERILHEALQIHQVELYSYQLMPNHYHLVIRPLLDGEMSRFMGWLGGTHTMRFHAHYHTSGMGIPAGWGIFTNSGTRAFRSRLTTIFSSCADMLSATRCVPGWFGVPKIGVGDRCGGGCRSPSQNLGCCPHGQGRDCRAGWNALTRL